MPRTICLSTFVFATLLCSHHAAAKGKAVSAIGQAAVVGDRLLARDQAIADAKRKAVEQAVGAIVSSQTITQNFELISDRIFSKSEGYVRSYKITQEGEKEGVYQVTIAAQVKTGPLNQDVKGILAILEAKGMPRILVMLSEQNIGSDKTAPWWAGTSSFSLNVGAVENAWIESWRKLGFEFVDRQTLQGQLQTGSATTEPSDAQVKTLAQGTGADVVIIGKAFSTDSGPVRKGAPLHSIQASLSARALNLDTGRILGTTTQNAATAHRDGGAGGTKALQAVAQMAAQDLKEKILKTWQKDIGGAQHVSLTLRGVKKSKLLRQIESFLRNELRGVQKVRKRSYKKKVATLDVELKGSAQDLAEMLEDKKFGRLGIEIDEITSNTVVADLK